MEVITQYGDRKTELEGRIQALESEKASLMSDISSLKEKLEVLELERSSASLVGQIEELRTEKTVLEERIAGFETGPSESTNEGYEV